MNDDQTSQEPNNPPLPAAASSTSKDFFSQSSNLLLIASGLIFIGFFMPWLSVDSRLGSFVPTINGTYLISQAGKAEGNSFIAVLFLLLIPVCSGVIGYGCYRKNTDEKRLTICISLSTLVPVMMFVLNLFFSSSNEVRELKNFAGGASGMGIGLIMMIIGSLYYLFYLTKDVAKRNKDISSKSLIKYGIIGGVAVTIVSYLIIKSLFNSHGPLAFLVLLAFIAGIVITSNLHKKELEGKINYPRILVIGFIIAIAFVFSAYLLCILFYSREMTDVPGAILGILLVGFAQLGLIISSVAGVWIAKVELVDVQTNQQDNVQMIATPSIADNFNVRSEEAKKALSSFFLNILSFVKKYKKIFISAISVATLAVIVWFILKPNPDKEGTKAGQLQCNCVDKKVNENIKIYEDFLKSFASNNFKRRAEANKNLADLQNKANVNDTVCKISADEEIRKMRDKFSGDIKALYRFNNAVNNRITACFASNEAKKNDLMTKVNNKILSINDPEPDTTTIKTDLLGKTIPGWRFDFVSEFKQITILNTTRVPNRIEYLANLVLQGRTDGNSIHNAQVLVIYIYDGSQWLQVSANALFITYDYVIPTGAYANICTVPNCNWNATNDKNLSWKIGDYGYEYKSGPGLPGISLPSATCYLMKSDESTPVTVKFTYKPINQ